MKEQNIIHLLNNQSIHGSNVHHKISRSLLKSTNRHYECNWKKGLYSRSGAGCVNRFSYDGNMYLGDVNNNFSSYFQGCFTGNQPHFIATNIASINSSRNIGTEADWRIKDTLIYECNVLQPGDVEGLLKGHYENCLFALTSTSYIIQYLLRPTGWTVAKNVYLGHISFSHMNYDSQLERFVVKSKHNPVAEDADVRFYFAILATAPFGFKAVFAIRKSVFGSVRDAFVINGLIVVLSSESYSFYSLEYVLQHNTTHICDFGDRISPKLNLQHLGFPTEDSCVAGKYPYGLPVNMRIDKKPTLLFQLSCKGITGLSFGGFPWFCLGSHHQISKLYRVSSGKQVNTIPHGKYAFAMLDDEKKAYFHSDRSGRILCIEYDEIKCMKILETSNNKADEDITFSTCYSIKYAQDTMEKQRPQQKRSRSGRTYKPLIKDYHTELPSEIVHALDYDNALDVLAVLHTRVTGTHRANNKYAVTLYDNFCGEEIRTFDLETEISENDSYDWNLFFNDLMVVCTLKRLASCRSVDDVFTYHIHENI